MQTVREIRFGERYELRPIQGQLLVEGRVVSLGGRAFDLLCKLVECAGETVSKRELIERGWPDSIVEESNLQVQIASLRRVLEPGAIVTVAGRGYRLALTAEKQATLIADTPAPKSEVPKTSRRLSLAGAGFEPSPEGLLEREEALRELAAAFAQARDGRGSVCLVFGEAGIGRTALCNAFITGIDARVLKGSCEAFFSPRPLGPIHDFVAELDPGPAALLRQDNDHIEVFTRIIRSLKAQATVLCLEDLHWADPATLDFVRFVGHRIDKCCVLLLLTYRDDELSETHPLRRLLGDLRGPVRRIKLVPLSPLAVENLARNAGKSAEGVAAAAAGNPFEVIELLKTGGGLPESVRDAVLARVTKQRPDVQALLQLVSIVPDRLEQWIIQELLNCDEAAISEALSCGLLQSDGSAISFRRELDRQAVEQSLASHRARSLHGQILELLSENRAQNISFKRCLYHARAAHAKSEVLKYSILAAREASQREAHREAAALCRAALQDCGGSMREQHAELLEIYSVARSRFEANPQGSRADLETALEIWRGLGRSVDEGRVLRRLARVHWLLGDPVRANEFAQACVEQLRPFPDSAEYARAVGDQALTLLLTSKLHEAVAIGANALEQADRCSDERVRCLALVAIGGAEVFMGMTDEGLGKLEASLALALKGNFVVEAAIGYKNLARALYSARAYARLERRMQEAMSFVGVGKDLDIFANHLRAIQCQARFESGRWNEAQEIAQALLEAKSNGHAAWVEQTVLLLVKAGRGEFPESNELETAVRTAARSREMLNFCGPLLSAQAQVQWLRGGRVENLAGLRAAFAWANEAQFQRHIQELGYWLWRGGEQTVEGVDPESPRGLQIAGCWREAANAWHDLGCPLEEAQALLEGNSDAKQEARSIFVRLGAVGWLRRSQEFSARPSV